MTDSIRQYETELAELRTMLETDGYGIEVVGTSAADLDLRIVVTSPDTCADCLVPKRIMRDMIAAQLTRYDLTLRTLSYPADLPAGG